MAITNGYISLDALKEAIGENTDEHNDAYERAIEAASRQIDEFRGDQFWREPTPVPRLFRPDNPDVLFTGDFADLDGMLVEIDEDEDGTFAATWEHPADWSPEPLRRLNNRPYDRIVAVAEPFPVPVYLSRPLVRVTAHWGWPAIPDAVVQACQILAIDHFKSKDLTGGVAGFSDLGVVRVAAFNPQARALLAPFKLP